MSPNAEVLQRSGIYQPVVTSYVIGAYLCLAMLHAWTLEYQHDAPSLTMDKPMKTERQRPAGEDHRVALTTSSSTGFRRMPTICSYLSCGGVRSPGATERRNSSLGVRNDDDDDEG